VGLSPEPLFTYELSVLLFRLHSHFDHCMRFLYKFDGIFNAGSTSFCD
jgi:hypothetical protein